MPTHIYNCTITLAKDYTKRLRELASEISKPVFLDYLESILDENRKKVFTRKPGCKKNFRTFHSRTSFATYMFREYGIKDILNKNRFKQVGRVERYVCPIWYGKDNTPTSRQKTHIITLTDKLITFYSYLAGKDVLIIHFKNNHSAKTFFQSYLFGTVHIYRPLKEILKEEALIESEERLSKPFQSCKTPQKKTNKK